MSTPEKRAKLCELLQDEDVRLRLTAVVSNYLTDYPPEKGDDSEEDFDRLVSSVNDSLIQVSENPHYLESDDLLAGDEGLTDA